MDNSIPVHFWWRFVHKSLFWTALIELLRRLIIFDELYSGNIFRLSTVPVHEWLVLFPTWKYYSLYPPPNELFPTNWKFNLVSNWIFSFLGLISNVLIAFAMFAVMKGVIGQTCKACLACEGDLLQMICVLHFLGIPQAKQCCYWIVNEGIYLIYFILKIFEYWVPVCELPTELVFVANGWTNLWRGEDLLFNMYSYILFIFRIFGIANLVNQGRTKASRDITLRGY